MSKKDSKKSNKKNSTKPADVPQGLSKDNLVAKDDRFKSMHHDPRFRVPRKQDQKLKVDDRFKGMLSEERFQLNHKVDKYGRKEKNTTKDKLTKFYNIEGDDDEAGGDGEEDEDEDGVEHAKVSKQSAEYDPARGIGVVGSSSEESEDSSDEETVKAARKRMGLGAEPESESESEDDDVDWMDEEEQTNRFAVQGMDWDYVRAVDLLCLLESFKPAAGIVKSVKVYPSEFGTERMAKEDIAGPEAYDAGEDDDETIAETVLRQYQMDRLKYYYAVVECDAVETARAIYKECDGQEFLNSGCVMDLRFIPADMEFDEEVKQVATMVPTNYEPRDFTSGAQQQSKLKVTWDQNDPERAVTLHTAVTEEQLEEMDFKNFLASGSSDDESDDDDAGKQKYSELIAELKGTEAAKGDEVDMEITFAPGLKDDANAMLKKKEARDAAEKLGVWDQYLHKKREKKKTARKAAKEGTEMLDDDDDVAIDRNDPFFDEDFGSDFEDPDESRGNKATKPSSATQKSKVGKKADAAPDVDMELLLLPDNVAETGKEHFDLKEIIKQEKQKGRKGKKKSKKGAAEAVADDFKVDVADDRFQALFKKAEYAIDPTDAKYKSTKAMKTLQDERTKRRNKNENGHAEEPQQKKAKNKTTSTKALVDSIKRQAANNKSSKAGKRSGRTAE